MKKGKKIFQHNFWRKKTDERIGHTVQSVLGLIKNKFSAASSCVACSCNCGGGCSGECATSCEGGN